MGLVMPLDEWFFDRGPVEIGAALESFLPTTPPWETLMEFPLPWQEPEDLPSDIQEAYRQLDNISSLYQWYPQSSEWRSIASRLIPWDSLLLLPFRCLNACLAALKLKELAEKTWPGTLVKIGAIPIDPFSSLINREILIGSYATVLWNCWKGQAHEASLNVTACPKEVAILSNLIASIDFVPVYYWSEISQKLLSFPRWQMPSSRKKRSSLDDQERIYLRNRLEGLQSGIPEKFLLEWEPVIGRDCQVDTALLLKEWLRWSGEPAEENLGFDPVSL